MNVLGNIVWLIFGGLLASIGYFIGGFCFCLSIVGIPFGLQSFKLGVATLTPFGREVYELPDANSPLRLFFNIIWLVFFGWQIALSHIIGAACLALTIVGIPFSIQLLKLVPIALLPFGRELREVRRY